MPPPESSRGRRRAVVLITAAATLVVLAAVPALALALRDRQAGGGPSGSGAGQTGSQTPSASATPSATASATPTAGSTAGTLPPDEQCTDAIKSNAKWVCLTKATIAGSKITIEYNASFAGATPNVNGGYHLHIYGGDGTNPPDRIMGTHSPTPGKWYVEDKNPSVWSTTSTNFVRAIKGHPKVCARMADGKHRLIEDNSGKGTYTTGNCVPIVWI